MNRRTLPLHVAGMFVLGAVALVAAGALHEYRDQQWRVAAGPPTPAPVGTAGSTEERAARSRPVAVRVFGQFAESLEQAARALRAGDRYQAAARLDGAWHVADVMHAATRSEPATQALALVQAARTALADGDRVRAAELASIAAGISRAVRTGDVPRGTPAGYTGAILLNPIGVVLGEVVGADDRGLEVASGGMRHLLGFVDLSTGERWRVDIDDAVLGERRSVGTTMVVAAPRSPNFAGR